MPRHRLARPHQNRFNSTLVRLKEKIAHKQVVSKLRFQFHTGSIKSGDRLGEDSDLNAAFQFHTGSIKSETTNAPPHRTDRFQFHTGSIKRDRKRKENSTETEFQFHTGSIKRLSPHPRKRL